MLTVYRSPRKGKKSESSDSSDTEEMIPAGQQYVTKINGRLVLARQKRASPANATVATVDLLGEVFGLGIRTRVVHRRAASLDGRPPPLMVGGLAPQNQIAWTAPLPQQNFLPGPNMQIPLAPSPFLPYQPFFQPPPVPPQPTAPPVAYTVPPPKPTKEDFELLQSIDAEYNAKHKGKGHARTSSAPTLNDDKDGDSMVSRTTITITKHICANCRRVRSRQYHRENPIKPGEDPAPSFCGRCERQKEDSSTEATPIPRKEKKKDDLFKKKKLQKAKTDDRLSDDESPVKPIPEKKDKKSKSKKKQNEAQRTFLEDNFRDRKFHRENRSRSPRENQTAKPVRSCRPTEYTIFEEDSEEDFEPRGRQRSRYEGSDLSRRPLSPLATQSYVRQSRPDGHYDGLPRRTKQPRPRIVPESIYERSPSPRYREQPKPSHRQRLESPEDRRERRRKKHYEDDETSRLSGSVYAHDGSFDSVPARSMPSRENSFDSVDSPPSQESSRRRHRERSHPVPEAPKSWEASHVIHPQPGDDEVIVTERYIYRPKRNNEDPKTHSRRVTASGTGMSYDTRSRMDFSEADHSYYNSNWAHDDSSRESSVRGPAPAPRRGYRRDQYQNSELYSELSVDDSVEYQRAYDAVHQNIPRAPTPPSIISSSSSSSTETYQNPPPYPLSSDSETYHRLDNDRKGKEPQRPPPSSRRSRSTSSNYRPPFVREATDGGTEKALIPSPRPSQSIFIDEGNETSLITTPRPRSLSSRRSHSQSRSRPREYTVVDASDITRMERNAERHVRFRDEERERRDERGWRGEQRVNDQWGADSDGERGGGQRVHDQWGAALGSGRGPCDNWGGDSALDQDGGVDRMGGWG